MRLLHHIREVLALESDTFLLIDQSQYEECSVYPLFGIVNRAVCSGCTSISQVEATLNLRDSRLSGTACSLSGEIVDVNVVSGVFGWYRIYVLTAAEAMHVFMLLTKKDTTTYFSNPTVFRQRMKMKEPMAPLRHVT
ncbi:hypothetical protein HQ571_01435 [Candidatus Kuenenbacteria bacterium]|nr:hypothetical protein [Candidatus Kuenenbacteria bacterium]